MIKEPLEFWDIIDIKEVEKELWSDNKFVNVFKVTSDFINIDIEKVEFNVFDSIETSEEIESSDEWFEIWYEVDNNEINSEEDESEKTEKKKKAWFKVLEFSWEMNKELVSSIFTENEDFIFDEEWYLILFL